MQMLLNLGICISQEKKAMIVLVGPENVGKKFAAGAFFHSLGKKITFQDCKNGSKLVKKKNVSLCYAMLKNRVL